MVVFPALALPMMSMRNGPNIDLIRSSSGGSSGLAEEEGCCLDMVPIAIADYKQMRRLDCGMECKTEGKKRCWIYMK